MWKYESEHAWDHPSVSTFKTSVSALGTGLDIHVDVGMQDLPRMAQVGDAAAVV